MDLVSTLAARLQEARQAYYNDAAIMSDAAYDALEDQLRQLDPTHPLLTSVGAPVNATGAKVRHTVPMGSQNKAVTEAELASWHATIGSPKGTNALIVSDKADGISISLRYLNRKLVQASTRGDGQVGEDITENVKLMQGVPHLLPINYVDFSDNNTVVPMPTDVWVRGEIVCLLSDFAKYFAGESNPRNTAAGTAKRQSNNAKCAHLTVLAYQFLPQGGGLSTKEAEFQALRDVGFTTVNWETFADLPGVLSYYADYVNSIRAKLDYQIDGLIVELDDSYLRDSYGESGGRPNASVAFKFPCDSKPTILRNIIWQVGKSGRVTPVAEFDTVSLAGVNVSRASLYNESYMLALAGQCNVPDLAVGDQILVSRRGDVIPAVEELLVPNPNGKILYAPQQCPCCAATLTKSGEYLLCVNEDCEAQVTGAIRRWVSKVGVLHFGEAMIGAMVESGLVADMADLYTVDPAKVALLEVDGRRIGGAADRAFADLHAKKEMPLQTLVGSVGLSPLIGRSMAQTIMEGGFDTLDKMYAAFADQLAAIDGLSDTKAQAFVVGLAAKRPLIERLLRNGVTLRTSSGKLVGQTFCCTGFRDAALVAAIEAQGGTMKESVGKGLTYLIALDATGSSGKLDKARKNGTTVIDKAQAYALTGAL